MNRPATPKKPALLLLGPTGSGKTPLGDALALRGLWGRRCAHFDFGAKLRRLVEVNRPDDVVGADDLALLGRVLETGALLEDEQLPLALRIVHAFVAAQCTEPSTLAVLNGLPRHRGQAECMRAIVDVATVVALECSPEVVLARIVGNVAGDRAERVDDDREAVRRKLDIFRQRTEPLADYYRRAGARIERIEVTAAMTPDDARAELEGRGA
jgi:adenylate kinase